MSIQYERVFFVNGLLSLIVTMFMLAPALTDYAAGNPDWMAFVHAIAISGSCSVIVILASKDRWSTETISLKEGFLITASTWLFIPIVGSLPIWFMDNEVHFVDSWFESVSGMTTTGSTVLVGLDNFPPGILLWRSILSWIGGVGIVLMAMIMLPFLRVGGMHIFHTESSDRSEKILPRDSTLIIQIGVTFFALTLACMVSYLLAGMTLFDALNHALTTIATGGYSTHDASLGYYESPAIHWVATFFMAAASLPIVLYIKTARNQNFSIFSDVQVRGFLKLCAWAILTVTLYLIWSKQYDPVNALRVASFNVISIVSTTGYALGDFTAWGVAPSGLFLVLMLLGGCTGSTAGGIKTYRIQAMLQITKRYTERLYSPHRVVVLRYGKRLITDDIALSILAFISAYAGSLIIVTVGLTIFNVDVLTAFSGAITAVSNVGPGLGNIIGPAGNFSTLPDGAKIILLLAMILGRLEFFALLAILSRNFWR